MNTGAGARIVLLGATGMVGGYALRYALAHSDVKSVTAIGRRKLAIDHPKLTQVVHSDFSDCSSLSTVLANQDVAVFCLGTYTGTVSDAELRTVTTEYTIEFARALESSSPRAAFVFLSGSGADQTGKSRLAFARYKGEAEKALFEMGFPSVDIVRPAYIYPVEPRSEPNLGYRILRFAYPLLRVLFPGQVIRADDLAHVMIEAAVADRNKEHRAILENRDIQARARALAG